MSLKNKKCNGLKENKENWKHGTSQASSPFFRDIMGFIYVYIYAHAHTHVYIM